MRSCSLGERKKKSLNTIVLLIQYGRIKNNKECEYIVETGEKALKKWFGFKCFFACCRNYLIYIFLFVFNKASNDEDDLKLVLSCGIIAKHRCVVKWSIKKISDPMCLRHTEFKLNSFSLFLSISTPKMTFYRTSVHTSK